MDLDVPNLGHDSEGLQSFGANRPNCEKNWTCFVFLVTLRAARGDHLMYWDWRVQVWLANSASGDPFPGATGRGSPHSRLSKPIHT